MAIKCIHDSIRSWLHADIYFLLIRLVFTNNVIVLWRILKSEVKIFGQLDLANSFTIIYVVFKFQTQKRDSIINRCSIPLHCSLLYITAFMLKKNKTRKTSSAKGPYQHFDKRSKFAREKLIRGYAERYRCISSIPEAQVVHVETELQVDN